MVDEDFVMGYVTGYNDAPKSGGGGTIISKTITKNGTYHAVDDNADGYDPVIVKVKMSQKEIDDLIEWVIDQIEPQLPDGTEITPPAIDADNEFEPQLPDGADRPYLVGASSDGKYHQVMYSIVGTELVGTELQTKKTAYVDLYVNGTLVRHEQKMSVYDYPLNSLTVQSDGTVRVIVRKADGTVVNDKIYGAYINPAYATVWAI